MHQRKKIIQSGKCIAILGALSLLAFGLVQAAPLFAMKQGESQNLSRGAAPRAAAASGVAATFGIDEGGVVATDANVTLLAAGSGGNLVRMALSWHEVESTPGVFSFTGPDKRIQNILDVGMTPLVYLSDNPSWAAPLPCGPVYDEQLGAFESFVSAVAARYPQVTYWSLYNEVDNTTADPNNNFGGCFADPSGGGLNNNGVKDVEDYAILLKTAWQAVHNANPNAVLLMGSIAHDAFSPDSYAPNYPPSWRSGPFSYKFASDLFTFINKHPLPAPAQYMDGVPFNFYTAYGSYWEDVASGYAIQAKANALRKLMKSKGINVPLYVTETGNSSSSLGNDTQARCLDMVMVRGAAAKLKSIIWWTFKDYHLDGPTDDPGDDIPIHYGLVDENLAVKPSYIALQVLTTELNGFNFSKTFSNKSGFSNVEAYRFKAGATTKYIVWSSKIKSVTDKPECSWARVTQTAHIKAHSVRIVSSAGVEKIIVDNTKKDKDKTKGIIGIRAKASPQIIQVNP